MGSRRFAAVAVVVLAGCSGGSHRSAPTTTTPATRAEALCRRAVPVGTHLVSSEPTNVRQFRRTTIATIGPTQTHRFASLPATAFGAWCWTGGPGSYGVYEVASDGRFVQVVASMNGVSAADAHGPPAVP